MLWETYEKLDRNFIALEYKIINSRTYLKIPVEEDSNSCEGNQLFFADRQCRKSSN